MNTRIEAILFDLGNTLRVLYEDKPYQAEAKRKMAELAGTDMDPEAFYEFIDCRYEGYRKWAFDTMREAPEPELWTKWLLPDGDFELLNKNAIELTFQYRQTKGIRRIVKDGEEVISKLHARGYKLGIISNLITSLEVPDWLEDSGLKPYFDPVVLSSVCGLRKPAKEIYIHAAELAGVKPENIAYVGDNLGRDVTGAKEAGYAMNVIFITPEKLSKKPFTDANRPEAVIFRFRELLEIFPGYPEINMDAILPQNK